MCCVIDQISKKTKLIKKTKIIEILKYLISFITIKRKVKSYIQLVEP